MPPFEFGLPWSSADVIAITLAVLVAVTGFVLAAKQSRIIRDITALQSAVAELEIREKLGCVRNNLGYVEEIPMIRLADAEEHLRHETTRYSKLVVDDALASFPVLHFARERLQNEFIDALHRVFRVLNQQGYRDQLSSLYRGADEYAALLRDTGEKDLARRVQAAISEFRPEILP
jgi:hypothetical protein